MKPHETDFAYRDYGDFILVYGARSHGHFIIQDIYAVFFRMHICCGKDKLAVVDEICSEYAIDAETVSRDFDAFISEMGAITGSTVGDTEYGQTPKTGLSDRDIYGVMAQAQVPFSATIEITDVCNENCSHCYRGNHLPSYWTPRTFEDVLAQLRDMGCMHLTLTGGEPLTHRDFSKFIKLSQDYGFVLTLQTNGLLIDSDMSEELSSYVLKDVAVSLYSTDGAIHDSITNMPGSCTKTKLAIESLRERDVPVSVNMPVMTLNEGSMPDVKAFSDKVGGACHFTFKIIPSQDGSRDTASLNCFSEQKLYDCMIDPGIQLYNNLLPELEKTSAGDRYCDTCFRNLTLDAQGNVIICNAFRKPCGNVSDLPLAKIWRESDAITLWRNKTCFVNEACSQCEAYAYCEPCPAHSFTLTGDDSSIDEITCAFGKAFHKASMRFKTHSKGGVEDEGV